MSPHLSVKSDYIDLMYFSGVKHLKIIESDVKKKIIFDVSVSRFKGKESIKGYVRDLLYDGKTGYSPKLLLQILTLSANILFAARQIPLCSIFQAAIRSVRE